MNPTTRTPAPRDWLLAAQTAALLKAQLDSIEHSDWEGEDETRRAVATAAQGLAAIAKAATQEMDRRNAELAAQIAELVAEKRDDRRDEEARELAHMIGGA